MNKERVVHLAGTFSEHLESECPGPPVCPVRIRRLTVVPLIPSSGIGYDPPNGALSGIHALACVEVGARIFEGVTIWRWSLIRSGVTIGKEVSVGTGCVIGEDVEIGEGCRIQDGAKIYGPAILGREVFVGPGAVITNDRRPRVHRSGGWKPHDGVTIVEEGAVVGANATIIAGVTIGKDSFVGAGSVVIHDVPAGERVFGVPAQTLPNNKRYGGLLPVKLS
jgi:UDP-2-acetamido-3-amino-2,3-dideoxy-glucuronate N-acetyltransferase